MKKLIHLFIGLCLPCAAQTATIAPVTAPVKAGSATQVTFTLNVPCAQQAFPKNGGRVTLVMCPLGVTLPPLSASVPGQDVTFSLSGLAADFTCESTPTFTITVDPDGTKHYSGLSCTFTVKK